MPKWDVEKVRSEYTTVNKRNMYKNIQTDFLIQSSTLWAKNRSNDLRIPTNPVFALDDKEVYNLMCNCNNGVEEIEHCPHLTNKVLCDLLLEKYRKIETLLNFFLDKRNVDICESKIINIFKRKYSQYRTMKMESSKCGIYHFHTMNHIQDIILRPNPELSKEQQLNIVYYEVDKDKDSDLELVQEHANWNEDENSSNGMGFKLERKSGALVSLTSKRNIRFFDNDSGTTFSESRDLAKLKNRYKDFGSTSELSDNDKKSATSQSNHLGEQQEKRKWTLSKRKHKKDSKKVNDFPDINVMDVDDSSSSSSSSSFSSSSSSSSSLSSSKKYSKSLTSSSITVKEDSSDHNESSLTSSSDETSVNNPSNIPKSAISSSFDSSPALRVTTMRINKSKYYSSLDDSEECEEKTEVSKTHNGDIQVKNSNSQINERGSDAPGIPEEKESEVVKSSKDCCGHKARKQEKAHKKKLKYNNMLMHMYWVEMIRMVNRYNLSIIQELSNNPCDQCKDFFTRSPELLFNDNTNDKVSCTCCCSCCTCTKKTKRMADLQIANYESQIKEETLEIKKTMRDENLDTFITKGISYSTQTKRAPPTDILLGLTKNYKNYCPYCFPICHILSAIVEENIFLEEVSNAKHPNYELCIDFLFQIKSRILSGRENMNKKATNLLDIADFGEGDKKIVDVYGKKMKNTYVDKQLQVQGMSMMLSFIGIISPYPDCDDRSIAQKVKNRIDDKPENEYMDDYVDDYEGFDEVKVSDIDKMNKQEENVNANENENHSSSPGLVLRTTHNVRNEEGSQPEEAYVDPTKIITHKFSSPALQIANISSTDSSLSNNNKRITQLKPSKKNRIKIIKESKMEKMAFQTFKDAYFQAMGKKSKLPAANYDLSLASGVVLSGLKLVAYIVSNSTIMMASLIDSCLDIVSSLILLITSRIANSKKEYDNYPVGRKRIQTIGVLIFASIMSAFALQILSQAIISLAEGPGKSEFGVWPIAIMSCAVGMKLFLLIFCKFGVNWLKNHGDPSDLLEVEGMEACAQDHVNDILSNAFGLIFGVISKYVWFLDPVASMLLSLFIIYNWGKTAFEEIRTLLGVGASPEFVKLVKYICMNFDPRIRDVAQVVCYHTGTQITVELVLLFNPRIGITAFNSVASELKNFIEALPEVERCYIRIAASE